MSNTYEIIIAGFGGQGILSAGRILAYAGMLEDKYVSWLPSYGPEMRGGTANCHVIVSDEPIGSPIISRTNALIVMNTPSFEKFEEIVKPNGIIIADSSIIHDVKKDRKDISYYFVPATRMATDIGNKTFANIIILGKLIGKTGILMKDSIIKALEKVLPKSKHHLIPQEIEAIEKGINFED